MEVQISIVQESQSGNNSNAYELTGGETECGKSHSGVTPPKTRNALLKGLRRGQPSDTGCAREARYRGLRTGVPVL